MLKIEFKVARLAGSFRNDCALINADSAEEIDFMYEALKALKEVVDDSQG